MTETQLLTLVLGAYIFGILIGVVIAKLFQKKDGELVIDLSSPEKDLYQLRFETPLDELPKRKKVIFTVKVERTIDARTIDQEAERLLKELEDSQNLQRP